MAEVDVWFRSVSLAGLQELQATNLLPPHAMIFAPTLRVLRLDRRLPIPVSGRAAELSAP
jgi:hypothetical protein